jgi:hypothetical protein
VAKNFPENKFQIRMTNTTRTPLVNATRTLWKTQNNSKIVGEQAHVVTAAFGRHAKAKPSALSQIRSVGE